MPPQKCWSFIKTVTMLETYLGEEKTWPEPLVTLRKQDKDLGFCALGMAIAFLQDALIDEQTIKPGSYYLYEPESKKAESLHTTP